MEFGAVWRQGTLGKSKGTDDRRGEQSLEGEVVNRKQRSRALLELVAEQHRQQARMPVIGMHHVGAPTRNELAHRNPGRHPAEVTEPLCVVGPITAVLILIEGSFALEQARAIDHMDRQTAVRHARGDESRHAFTARPG